MKVRALIMFDDYLEGVTRQTGEVFEVTEERHEEIITKGGPWVEVVEEEEIGEDQEEEKTKRRKKK